MWEVSGTLEGEAGVIEVTWGDIEDEADAARIEAEAESLLREAHRRWFPGDPVTVVAIERRQR